MLSKHVSIVIEVDHSNDIIQTYKYSQRRGLFECFFKNVSILIEVGYSNAIMQTYKYSH